MYKTVLLLWMLMLIPNAQGASGRDGAYIPLMHQSACAASEKEAILKVDTLLKKRCGIDSAYLYSKNIYIRQNRNANGEYCVKGSVTQEGFERYRAELAAEYESIMGEIEDLNDGISYIQKKEEVDHLYQQVQRLNEKIVAAEKIAPIAVKQIAETKASLGEMINAAPVVNFKVTGCNGKYETACRLVFVSSIQDDSSTVAYQWDFGDGTYSKLKNPVHYFKQPGGYKVTLQITDGGKKQTEVSKRLRVSAKPKSGVKPNAGFKTDKKVYASGESVTFINLSSSKNSKVTEYSWNFGDGANAIQDQPKHSFKKPGVYKVRLVVKNSDGLQSDAVQTIRVVHPAIKYADYGVKFNRVVRKFGQPEKSIVKSGTLTQAYQYGNDWLLVKQNKIECRIQGGSFKTNLMGSPKDCNWYEKHAASAMYLSDM